MGIARKFIAQEVHKFSLCFSDRSVYDDIKKITLKIIKNDVDILLEAIEVFSCRSMFGPRKTQHFHGRHWSIFIDCFDRKMKRK